MPPWLLSQWHTELGSALGSAYAERIFGFLSRHLTRRVQDAHGGLSEMILSARHLARVGVEGANPFADSNSAKGLELFSTQRMVLVFPGERGTPFSGWSKAKSALDTASGVSGWWLHDLRRTLRQGSSASPCTSKSPRRC